MSRGQLTCVWRCQLWRLLCHFRSVLCHFRSVLCHFRTVFCHLRTGIWLISVQPQWLKLKFSLWWSNSHNPMNKKEIAMWKQRDQSIWGLQKRQTFNPEDLAWSTAPVRSVSVVSNTLSPSSSSYCTEHYQNLACNCGWGVIIEL